MTWQETQDLRLQAYDIKMVLGMCRRRDLHVDFKSPLSQILPLHSIFLHCRQPHH